MKRIRMPDASRVHAFAIVIDRHLSIDDLLPPVGINIGDSEVVIALSGEGFQAVFTCIEDPTLLQFSIAEIPCGEDGAGVISATHHQGRTLTVEVGDTGEKSIDAVSVAVTHTSFI